MNWFEINSQFSYIDKYKDPYIACNVLANSARNLCIDNLNCLSESEAISWILTNTPPKKLDKYLQYELHKESRMIEHLIDSLCYVDDKDIKACVGLSILNSIGEGHLIYEYRNIENEYLKSRIRILCNIIWNELKIIQNEDKIFR